jgi:hypothetical protein
LARKYPLQALLTNAGGAVSADQDVEIAQAGLTAVFLRYTSGSGV